MLVSTMKQILLNYATVTSLQELYNYPSDGLLVWLHMMYIMYSKPQTNNKEINTYSMNVWYFSCEIHVDLSLFPQTVY